MYDYRESKKRVEKIIKTNLEVMENNKLPKSESLTFKNSYYSWISCIFIDIRDSTNLFSKENNEDISKIMKSFTSELIEILRKNDNYREIGIRGDCVYAIYTTPLITDFYDLYILACYCNTYMKMLNELLKENDLPPIKAGIGIGASQTLVIKAGRENVGINDKIWIGDAVIDASNLSSIANTTHDDNIVISTIFYNNLIRYSENEKRFFRKIHYKNRHYYAGDIIITEFNDWINNGMKD